MGVKLSEKRRSPVRIGAWLTVVEMPTTRMQATILEANRSNKLRSMNA